MKSPWKILLNLSFEIGSAHNPNKDEKKKGDVGSHHRIYRTYISKMGKSFMKKKKKTEFYKSACWSTCYLTFSWRFNESQRVTALNGTSERGSLEITSEKVYIQTHKQTKKL